MSNNSNFEIPDLNSALKTLIDTALALQGDSIDHPLSTTDFIEAAFKPVVTSLHSQLVAIQRQFVVDYSRQGSMVPKQLLHDTTETLDFLFKTKSHLNNSKGNIFVIETPCTLNCKEQFIKPWVTDFNQRVLSIRTLVCPVKEIPIQFKRALK